MENPKQNKTKVQGQFVGIQKSSYFYGKRKIGIDTNILIKLYNQPSLFDYEESRIFDGNIVYTHAICKYEFIKALKKDLGEDKAREEASNFIKEHKIMVIYPKECFISKEEFQLFEQEANKKFIEKGKSGLKCHCPDSIIILAFKKCGINRVISTDLSFRESAILLGMDGSSLPSLDAAISRKLRQAFDYKKSYKKKFR
jgi:predicted nucleic acid-binding protein